MAVAEEQPLLHQDVERVEPTVEQKRSPLPYRQLAIVYLIQFSEPLTGMVIYPFIAQLVLETGVTHGDPKTIGYYAGIVESMFFFSEFLTCLQWGRLSDYYGRRPVLLFGPLGLALSMYAFGLSKSFWQLCLFRFLQGMFNGNIGVSKSVMAELTDSTNRAKAFAMMPLMWSVADTLAPLIGATANPATEFPDVFGGITLLVKYPYFLPCAISGSLALLVFIFALFDLKETLPAKTGQLVSSQPRTEGYGAIGGEAPANPRDEPAPPPLTALVRSAPVRRVLVVYGFVAFFDMAMAALLPIFCYTSIADGGLGFSSRDIGVVLAVWGVYNVFFQLYAAPRIIDRFGAFKTQITTLLAIPLIFVLYPMENAFAKAAGSVNGAVGALIAVHLALSSLIYVGYGTIHMFIVDSSPSSNALGAVNGIAQTAGTLIRTFSPWVATSLFSLSVDRQLVGGKLVYILLGCAAVCAVYTSVTLLPRRLRSE